MWILLFIVALAGVLGLVIWRRQHNNVVETKVAKAKRTAVDNGSPLTEERIDEFRSTHEFPVPSFARTGLIVAAFAFLGLGLFDSVYFYAEPGYIYHVRTILGQEKAVDDIGYEMHLFGRVSPWKKAVTVQADTIEGDVIGNVDDDGTDTETNQPSATMKALNIVFLDQVDADVSATARFRIPTDEESFFAMAHEYRTPANLLRTALIPAFKETLQATASLMTAEDYYSGARTEFNNEFEKQLSEGVYVVNREEKVVKRPDAPAASANASLGTEQQEGIDGTKIEVIVEKTGTVKRQKFLDFGIQLVEGRVTEMEPNEKFLERMDLKQKASADRAIAREQKIQEVEQKLLAEARGARQIAEKQAEAKVVQIEKTTDAETAKQLAVTAANLLLEQARIDKETSAVRLEQARIDAETQTTLADAQAYEKNALLEADNALQVKLDAEVEIQGLWAAAYAKRAVPQYVFGGGNGVGGTPVGSDTEASNFMRLMTMEAAKNLNNNRSVDAETK